MVGLISSKWIGQPPAVNEYSVLVPASPCEELFSCFLKAQESKVGPSL